MATTRRKATTTSRPSTEAAAVKEPTMQADKPVVQKTTKKTFDANSPIVCRSITQGVTFMEGRNTHIVYRWDGYGAEIEVEYRDLVSETRVSNSSFVYGPMIIVEDENFINEFPTLKKFYEQHYAVRDLRAILDLPADEMRQQIEMLPKGAQDQLKNIASAAVSNGSIDSMRKINTLNEVFGIDMSMVADIINS